MKFHQHQNLSSAVKTSKGINPTPLGDWTCLGVQEELGRPELLGKGRPVVVQELTVPWPLRRSRGGPNAERTRRANVKKMRKKKKIKEKMEEDNCEEGKRGLSPPAHICHMSPTQN